MKRIGVIPASGIGDSLLMQILAHHLTLWGYEVTTFSNYLPHLRSWLKGGSLRPQPSLDEIHTLPASYDALFIQHDNSPKARHISQLRLSSACLIYHLYGHYHPSKHLPWNGTYDFLFDASKSVATNLVLALKHFFPNSTPTKENGLSPPWPLLYRRHPKRIAIHPFGNDPHNHWLPQRFLTLQAQLVSDGYEPLFVLPPHESPEWPGQTFRASSLEELATFLYESAFFIGNDSGPAHLASCLQIPHLVIGKSRKHLNLWAPDWLKGEQITPAPWLVHFKGLKIKDNYWPYFISTRCVINKFKSIAKQYK